MKKEKCGLPKLLELGSLFHTEFLWLVQTDENTRGQKQTKQPQPYYSWYFFSDSRASCIKCLVFLIGIPWCLILLIFVSYAVPSPYAIEATCKLLYMHMLESHKFIWFLLCYPLSISCVFLIDSLDPAFHMTEPVLAGKYMQAEALVAVYWKFPQEMAMALQGNPFASTKQSLQQLPHHNNRS